MTYDAIIQFGAQKGTGGEGKLHICRNILYDVFFYPSPSVRVGKLWPDGLDYSLEGKDLSPNRGQSHIFRKKFSQRHLTPRNIKGC